MITLNEQFIKDKNDAMDRVRVVIDEYARLMKSVAKAFSDFFDKLRNREDEECMLLINEYPEHLTTMRFIEPNDKLKRFILMVVRSKIFNSGYAKITCPFIERKIFFICKELHLKRIFYGT